MTTNEDNPKVRFCLFEKREGHDDYKRRNKKWSFYIRITSFIHSFIYVFVDIKISNKLKNVNLILNIPVVEKDILKYNRK